MNQMDIMNMLRSGQNPQQLAFMMLQNQMSNTPLGDNLIKLAQAGDASAIEKIVRNLCQARGLDFDKEFDTFKKQIGIK